MDSWFAKPREAQNLCADHGENPQDIFLEGCRQGNFSTYGQGQGRLNSKAFSLLIISGPMTTTSYAIKQ